ncbi:hypothetical protein H4S02_010537 [Coemansia sp. RSA 2611]|nr:hypothetical protein IWW54_006120 [Coemansia sp. RSA 2705]KAJ2366108.1 hypothetical protein H4S02_010537 [Coemansia sp. RSA 2611]
MVNPISVIFGFLQTKTRVQIWLYEQKHLRFEGLILGFDEFMNVVLDDTKEVHANTGAEKHIGRILLKGDNITLIHHVQE